MMRLPSNNHFDPQIAGGQGGGGRIPVEGDFHDEL